MTKKITLKSEIAGLLLVFQEDMPMKEIQIALEALFKKAGSFFEGSSINLLYQGLNLTRGEEQEILIYFREKIKADIKSFLEKQNTVHIEKKATLVEYNEFHKGTLRSGQIIKSDRNLVIIGDVNPGAEIEANGSIVVLGNLRGRARAGMDKNFSTEIYVAALNLEPMLLEIEGFIARSPDKKEMHKEITPEIAYIKDGKMIIDSIKVI